MGSEPRLSGRSLSCTTRNRPRRRPPRLSRRARHDRPEGQQRPERERLEVRPRPAFRGAFGGRGGRWGDAAATAGFVGLVHVRDEHAGLPRVRLVESVTGLHGELDCELTCSGPTASLATATSIAIVVLFIRLSTIPAPCLPCRRLDGLARPSVPAAAPPLPSGPEPEPEPGPSSASSASSSSSSSASSNSQSSAYAAIGNVGEGR